MIRNIIFIIVFFSLIIEIVMANSANSSLSSEEIISVEGRLIEQPVKPQSNILLYSSDGNVYNLCGEFKDLLKSLLFDFGEKNYRIRETFAY